MCAEIKITPFSFFNCKILGTNLPKLISPHLGGYLLFLLAKQGFCLSAGCSGTGLLCKFFFYSLFPCHDRSLIEGSHLGVPISPGRSHQLCLYLCLPFSFPSSLLPLIYSCRKLSKMAENRNDNRKANICICSAG